MVSLPLSAPFWSSILIVYLQLLGPFRTRWQPQWWLTMRTGTHHTALRGWEDANHLCPLPLTFYSRSYMHPFEYGDSKAMRLDGWIKKYR